MDMLYSISRTISQKARKLFPPEITLALAACAIAAPSVIYLLVAYLNLDFWWDEVYSLDFFVFVPLKTVVTDYHRPNNHIFANLLNHIYVYSLGLDDVSLLENPWKIRVLMLIYAVITSIYAYLIGKDFFGRIDGIAVVGVLWTTLPFLNFAVQVRGYSLSIMLLCMIFYHSFHFHRSLFWRDGIMVALGVSLLLYTIPSNIYVVLSMIIYWLGVSLVHLFDNKHKVLVGAFFDRNTILVVLMVIGCALAALLYIPVFPNVIQNRYVETTGALNVHTLSILAPQVLMHLLSGRWILLISALFGALFITREIRGSNDTSLAIRVLLMPTTLLVPFIISAIRGDSPYDRTFIVLVVPFSVFFGVALSKAIKVLSGQVLVLIVIFITISTFGSFFYTISERDRILRSNLENGGHSHNILVNYYQRYYTPSLLMKEFITQYEEGSIFVSENWVDKVAMPRYMLYWAEIYEKTIDEWHKSDDLYLQKDWLQSGKTIYIFTSKPDAVRILEGHHPEIACTRITSPGQLGMVLRCVHRSLPSRPVPAQPDGSRPWIALGKGWHPVERNGSETYRWGSADNRIWLVNPYDISIHVTLALTLESYDTARPVELWDGTRLLASWEVQRARRTYRLGATIAPGRTRLSLRAPTAYDPRSRREVSIVALQARITDYVAVESR